MKRILVIILALTAVFSSCKKKTVVIGPESGKEVEFTAAVENYSTTKATESAFEAGDRVRIMAGDPINKTTVGSVSGEKIIPEEPMRWRVKQEEPTTFAAVYQLTPSEPVAPAAETVHYDLLSGTAHHFRRHTAFMVATATASPNEPVKLVFKHPFSKINIVIDNQSQFMVTEVWVKGAVMDATLDLMEKELVLGSVKKDFQAVTVGEPKTKNESVEPEWDHYAAVIMPQQTTLTITVVTQWGKEYDFVQDKDFTFKPGTAYQTDLHIDPLVAEPVTMDFTVVPWADGGTLDYEVVTD